MTTKINTITKNAKNRVIVVTFSVPGRVFGNATVIVNDESKFAEIDALNIGDPYPLLAAMGE